MTHKLIMVEGIPGSGKSTTAKQIDRLLQQKGVKTRLYSEGDPHPADLAWQAVVPLAELPGLQARYEALWPKVEPYMQKDTNYAYIAYTKVRTEDYGFYANMESREVYDSRKGSAIFDELHINRWNAFGQAATKQNMVCIFECAYMQNHITELMFCRKAGFEEIKAHMIALANAVRALNPLLIYLSQPDVEKTILHIAKERQSAHGDWIDQFVAYCEDTPYAKVHGVNGFSGAVEMMRRRKAIELELLPQLPMEYVILETESGRWDLLEQQVKKVIQKI